MKKKHIKSMFSLSKTQPPAGFRGEIALVAGYWRSDTPDGIEIVHQFCDPTAGDWNAGDGGKELSRWLEEQLPAWDANEPPDGSRVLAQLAAWGQAKETLGEDHATVALMNIYWLQRRGLLQSDNSNGMMWHWILDGQLLIAEQNPLTADPDRVLEGAIDGTDVARSSDLQGSIKATRTIMDYVRKHPIK